MLGCDGIMCNKTRKAFTIKVLIKSRSFTGYTGLAPPVVSDSSSKTLDFTITSDLAFCILVRLCLKKGR